jgi:hypothetical protein
MRPSTCFRMCCDAQSSGMWSCSCLRARATRQVRPILQKVLVLPVSSFVEAVLGAGSGATSPHTSEAVMCRQPASLPVGAAAPVYTLAVAHASLMPHECKLRSADDSITATLLILHFLPPMRPPADSPGQLAPPGGGSTDALSTAWLPWRWPPIPKNANDSAARSNLHITMCVLCSRASF